MPAFPSTQKFGWRDLQEAPQPVVARSEVERGIPRQRRTASDAMVQIQLMLFFDTKAEAASFETWFYTDIVAGQAWFDFTHPRTGQALQARVVGGQLGPLQFDQRTLNASKRAITIEFVRP